MNVFNSVYPYVVMWFALLDATILVAVGTYIGFDFLARGPDSPDSYSRFVPAAFFFAGFNGAAVLILAGARALLGVS